MDKLFVNTTTYTKDVYLEFLMGASSIDDFFSRMSSIDDLTEYDHDLSFLYYFLEFFVYSLYFYRF